MKKYNLSVLWICLTAILFSSCGKELNYEDSPSIKLAQLAQDSMILANPQEARKLIDEARVKAQDSAEYYYSEAVRSSLLMTLLKSDSALDCINRVKEYCAPLPHLSRFHYDMLILVENNRGNVLQYAYKADSAIIAYKKAIEYCQKGGFLRKLPRIYCNLGSMYGVLNDFPKQAYYYRRGVFLGDSLNIPAKDKFTGYYSLGGSYLFMNNFEQAKEYFDKAYKSLDIVPLYYQFLLLNNYVNLYYYHKDYARSWEYLMKIFPLVEPHQDEMPFEYAMLRTNYADLSIKLGTNIDQAKIYLDDTKRFFEENKNPANVYYVETLQLALALKKNDMQTAQKLVNRFEKEHISDIQINYLQNRNEALIDYYQKIHDYNKAFSLLQDNIQIDDSFKNETQKNYIADLSMRYMNDTTHLKHRVIISKQENKIEKLRLEMIFGAVIAIGLIVYFIEHLKRIKKDREHLFEQHLNEISKLKMQTIREKISPHLTFNILNREINCHPESATEYQRLTQLTKLLRKGLELSNRLAIPLSEELDFVSNYVSLLQETGNKFMFRLHKEGDICAEEAKVPSMIIQIPVENAIKHGFTETGKENIIDVFLKDVQTGIKITITNNGQKYAPFATADSRNNTGTGLKVIYQSIALMNSRNKEQITFNIGEVKEGTMVSIYVPYRFVYDWETSGHNLK